MARFSGKIGYVVVSELEPGVYGEQQPVERHYVGDIDKFSRRRDSGENLNDDFILNNVVSITADAYAFANIYAIRYVKWLGTAWKVSNIDVDRPRLTLTLGGVYNGPTCSDEVVSEIDGGSERSTGV